MDNKDSSKVLVFTNSVMYYLSQSTQGAQSKKIKKTSSLRPWRALREIKNTP
jgi:hypothetical protein